MHVKNDSGSFIITLSDAGRRLAGRGAHRAGAMRARAALERAPLRLGLLWGWAALGHVGTSIMAWHWQERRAASAAPHRASITRPPSGQHNYTKHNRNGSRSPKRVSPMRPRARVHQKVQEMTKTNGRQDRQVRHALYVMYTLRILR